MSRPTRSTDSCPWRSHVRATEDGEVATCGLLQQISGVGERELLRVCRDACDACCESFEPTTQDLNPIIATHLYTLAERVVSTGGVDGCSVSRAHELNQWAERSLPAVAPDEDDCFDPATQAVADVSHVRAEEIARLIPPPPQREGRRITDWAVGVTTAPRRMPTLQQSVDSIIKAGWDDPILLVDGQVELPAAVSNLHTCRRDSSLGAFPSYVVSLWELYMRNPHADAYMMIQDDALLLGTSAMREYLESVLWPNCDRPLECGLGGAGPHHEERENPSCIASLYCSTRYTQPTIGWHRFDESWIWGAVAFVFSPEALRALLTSPMLFSHRTLPDDKGLSKIDVLVGQFAVANEIPIYYPCPSLVQHIGTVSTIWDTARAVLARRASQYIGDLIEPPERE